MYIQDDTAAAIRRIQEYLYEIYLFEGLSSPPPIDGIYGKETKEAVFLFQMRKGIIENGIVDLRTFEQLRDTALKYKKNTVKDDYLYSDNGFPLSLGASGTDIEALHALLRSLAAYDTEAPPIPRTAYYSNDTNNAIRYFQKIFQQEQTGIVDAALYERLETELSARRSFC